MSSDLSSGLPGLVGGSNRKLLCLEVNPPRGAEVSQTIERIAAHIDGLDCLNVTDCALAKMRFAALPFGAMLKQRFQREVLVNLSCRDRNLIALQSDLLAGWSMGVRSVVALTGDAVTVGDSPDRKGVFEVNSIGLLQVIAKLNSGVDLNEHPLTGGTAYLPGVVVNPNARNRTAEIRRLTKKREAGAQYALSQPVFDAEQARSFVAEAKSSGVPIMLGLLPFKSAAAAEAFARVPGIKVPEELLNTVRAEPDRDFSELAIALCENIARKTAPYVCGYHVISGATPKLALRLVDHLKAVVRGL